MLNMDVIKAVIEYRSDRATGSGAQWHHTATDSPVNACDRVDWTGALTNWISGADHDLRHKPGTTDGDSLWLVSWMHWSV